MKKKRRKRHYIRKIILNLLTVLFGIVLGCGAFFGVKGYKVYRDAIEEKPLDERVQEIRSTKGFTPYSELSPFYIEATISVEDRRFKDHCGIDPIAVGRAAWTDIKAMSFVEGGSTITQQLAKNLLFTRDKKIERKAAEVFAVLEMESKYTKEEIFELYANTIYFGDDYYGIHQASEGYFGKEPSEITDYEAAVLAGVVNAPSAYSPDSNKELTVKRVKQVLDSMVQNKMLTQEEADALEESE